MQMEKFIKTFIFLRLGSFYMLQNNDAAKQSFQENGIGTGKHYCLS